MESNIDPIQFEVIRNTLVEATEEMAVALRRSAYSINVKTRQDFSCAFFDRDLRIIAQAFTQPVHLGSMVELVPRAVRSYGPDNLREGDMLVTNDPYSGGVHLNGGEVTFSIAAASGNMAKMIYGAEDREVGNGGGAV